MAEKTIDVWATRIATVLNDAFSDGYDLEIITGLHEGILIRDSTGDQSAQVVVTTAMGWLVENG